MALKLPALPSLQGVEVTTVVVGVAVILIVTYELIQQLPSAQQVQSWLWVPNANDTTGDPNSIGDTSEANLAGMGAIGWGLNIVNHIFAGIPQSLVNEIIGEPWKPGDTGS